MKRIVNPISLFISFVLPVIGVLHFDWNVTTLLLFYWIETDINLLRQCVEATFAGRPHSEGSKLLNLPLWRLRKKAAA